MYRCHSVSREAYPEDKNILELSQVAKCFSIFMSTPHRFEGSLCVGHSELALPFCLFTNMQIEICRDFVKDCKIFPKLQNVS